MTRTIIVENYGELYRMSYHAYVQYLKRVAAGGDTQPPGRIIGTVRLNATDLTTEQAQMYLESEQGESQGARQG